MKYLLSILLITFIYTQPDGYDCNGQLNGPAVLDSCDICTGGQNSCITYNQFLGCDGVCFSGREIDDCNVCNLDNDLLNLGHLNNDNVINITDVIIMMNIILNSGSFNTLADLDGNCAINVTDVVALLNQIFYGFFSNTDLYSNDPTSMTPDQTRLTIQNHINDAANQGKDLFFEHPGLTYTINGTIYIPSDMKIDFNNTIIRRQTGDDTNDVFDMLVNDDINGNYNIVLKNLIIDGNRFNDPTDSDDDLSQHNPYDRFSGLKFLNVYDSKLINITVQRTVNGEQAQDINPAGGIFFTNGFPDISSQYPGCNNIYCNNINAHDNDGTGIIIHNSKYITIDSSHTTNNKNSGIGSQDADYCHYYRITSENNGQNHSYSNISINGECSVAYDLTTSAASMAGLNIGHPNEKSNADFSIIKDVESFDNESSGIMIRNADYVQLSHLDLHSNEGNNFLIKNVFLEGVLWDASNVRIKNAAFYDYHNNNHSCENPDDQGNGVCGGYGLRIEGSSGHETTRMGHIIYNSEIYDNFFNGIGIINLDGDGYTNNFIDHSIWIGEDVEIYNNGRADEWPNQGGISNHYGSGIRLYYSEHSKIDCADIDCDEGLDPFSQDVGIHITNGGNHNISTYYVNSNPDPFNPIPFPYPCSTINIENPQNDNIVNGHLINGDYSFDPNVDNPMNFNNNFCD